MKTTPRRVLTSSGASCGVRLSYPVRLTALAEADVTEASRWYVVQSEKQDLVLPVCATSGGLRRQKVGIQPEPNS